MCFKRSLGQRKKIDTFTTDEDGNYVWEGNVQNEDFTFELRVENKEGLFIPISKNLHSHQAIEELNLIVPASELDLDHTSEFAGFHKDIKPLLEGKKLGDTERGEDLTFLYQNTGWDARVLALGAKAEKLARESDLSSEMLYGLLRAGLPADKEELALHSVQGIRNALTKTNEKGITQIRDIDAATKAFRNYSKSVRANIKLPGGINSVADFLENIGMDSQEQEAFDKAYFEKGLRGTELWEELKLEVDNGKIATMQQQGKLAFLTLNNVSLSKVINEEFGNDISDLVDKNYYKANVWADKLKDLANGNEDQLNKLIPNTYLGEETEEKLNNYANDLARKVRISYPTQTLKNQIKEGEFTVNVKGNNVNSGVQRFLNNALTLDSTFTINKGAFGKFTEENRVELMEGVDETDLEGVKVLKRMYQITPDDDTLKVCLDLGFQSAQDIISYEEEEFLRYFADRFKRPEIARLLYHRSRQITDVTYNFFGEVKSATNSLGISTVSPSVEKQKEVSNNLIKQFPNLESLFGALDYCECEHCKSVLSPAAYLVDLLQFLDRDDTVWTNFIEHWNATHDAANQFDLKYKKPYDELVERRPDIVHLELTCENTNTVLPYIDVVNEILEYYVAQDTLTANAVVNTLPGTQTEDLVAEPQNVLPEAYQRLSEFKYPFDLPFDLWLETVRGFSEHFDLPLWQLLQHFLKTDHLDVHPDPSQTTPFAYREIFIEYLGLTPIEYDIFTSGDLDIWFEWYGYTDEVTALAQLSSAKQLSRRLGVSYKELTQLMQSHFLNPQLNNLTVLRKMELDVRDIFSFKEVDGYPQLSATERASFLDKLTAQGLDEAWLNTSFDNGDFNGILVLFDTNTGCNFDETLFRYVNTEPATPLDFMKLNYLARLQKKLGWSLEELDQALVSFTPKDALPITMDNIQMVFQTILIYLSHLKWLNNELKLNRNEILSFWGDLNTKGEKSLYEQYFLNTVTLREYPVFDNALGFYLQHLKSGQYEPFTWDATQAEDDTVGNVSLTNHLHAVTAAFELTNEDVDLILAHIGLSLSDAPLNISILSSLYRFKKLAQGLRLDIHEIISLIHLSGIDPFLPLENDYVSELTKDHPYHNTIAFVKLAKQIKERDLSIEDLDYLIRHQFDSNSNYQTQSNDVVNLARTIHSEIIRIRQANLVFGNNKALSDEELFQLVSAVYVTDLAETFKEMWLGTKMWTVTRSGVPETDKISTNTFDDDAELEVFYNDIRQEETLVFNGVLSKTRRDELKNKYLDNPSLSDEQEAHIEELLDLAHNFFIQDLSFIYPSGLDVEVEYQRVFDVNGTERQVNLVPALVQYLNQKLINQFIVETLAEEFDADTNTVSYLTEYHAMENIMDLAENPISIAFQQNVISKAQAILKGDEILPITSGQMVTYIEVPNTGDFRFYVTANAPDIEVKLSLNSNAKDVITLQTSSTTDMEFSYFAQLKANTVYEVILNIDGVATSDTEVHVLVKGENLPKTDMAEIALFSGATIHQLQRNYEKLAKSFMILQNLDISDREIQYVHKNKDDFGRFDLSNLPANVQEGNVDVVSRFEQLMDLGNYTLTRNKLVNGSDDLITVFENVTKDDPDSLNEIHLQVAKLVRRPVEMIQAISASFGWILADFRQYHSFQKIGAITQLLHRFGVSIGALENVTSIIDANSSNIERYQIANNFKNTIKARYSVSNWRKIAASIYDKLRQKKRDVLVSYILHQKNFARQEQLFEFFLIDTGMEPVVKTSRIKLAISAIQTFIQRCLLNLEGPVLDSGGNVVKKGIMPSAILAKHWEWMKRYRVWEANRKIFLFPENWLEPEFRDDKSHLFEELEGTLLQGDVSQDLVEQAFFDYLKQLEQISRLDMRAMYCEQSLLNPLSNTIHVLGRTFNLPHEYFYRTYSSGGWTPWIPLGVEIEGNHITMIKWRGRIHVFWLTFIEKAKSKDSDSKTFNDMANDSVKGSTNKDVDVQLNWTEYYQGKWATREAGGIDADDVITLEDVGLKFDRSKVFVHSTKNIENGEEREVEIHITYKETSFSITGRLKIYPNNKSFKLRSKISKPETTSGSDITTINEFYKAPVPQPFTSAVTMKESRYQGVNGQLEVEWTQSTKIIEGGRVS